MVVGGATVAKAGDANVVAIGAVSDSNVAVVGFAGLVVLTL